MVDELVSTEKLDEQTRATMKKGLKHLLKVRDEEKAGQRTPGGSAVTKAAIGE